MIKKDKELFLKAMIGEDKELFLEGALGVIFGKQRLPRSEIKKLKRKVLKLSKSIKSLSDREHHILKSRLGMNITLKEVGDSFGGITRERVRQLEVRAGRKIRNYLIDVGREEVLSIKVK